MDGKELQDYLDDFSLRDVIAIAAMAAILSAAWPDLPPGPQAKTCTEAYGWADAMLKARKE